MDYQTEEPTSGGQGRIEQLTGRGVRVDGILVELVPGGYRVGGLFCGTQMAVREALERLGISEGDVRRVRLTLWLSGLVSVTGQGWYRRREQPCPFLLSKLLLVALWLVLGMPVGGPLGPRPVAAEPAYTYTNPGFSSATWVQITQECMNVYMAARSGMSYISGPALSREMISSGVVPRAFRPFYPQAVRNVMGLVGLLAISGVGGCSRTTTCR